MAIDIKVPPLVGTYGPAGAGKSADKIRAFPNAFFFANPGGLIPLVSLLRLEIPEKRVADISKVASVDQMRAVVDAVLRQDKTIKALVIDDLSMIAGKTEREVKGEKKDGRQAYGIIAEKIAAALEDWRNTGLIVSVDTHLRLPDWAVDKEDKEKPHTPDNLVAPGGPNLPGRKAGPEAIKAFDMFFRTFMPTSAMPTGLPMFGGGPGGYVEKWPWRYTAGPYNSESYKWETKDRWGVASPSNGGELPLNIGEILRFVQRKHNTKWNLPRYADKAFERDEEYVAWAAQSVLAGMAEPEAFSTVARRLIEAKRPTEHIAWVMRDIRARIDIERLHTPAAALAALGISV